MAFAPAALQAQEDEAPSGLPVKYALQFADARHDYNVGNLRGALTTYRDLLDELPNDARVTLWIARCRAGLRREDLALTYLDKVAESDAELANEEQRFRGEVLHALGRYEEAIEAFAAPRFRPTRGRGARGGGAVCERVPAGLACDGPGAGFVGDALRFGGEFAL